MPWSSFSSIPSCPFLPITFLIIRDLNWGYFYFHYVDLNRLRTQHNCRISEDVHQSFVRLCDCGKCLQRHGQYFYHQLSCQIFSCMVQASGGMILFYNKENHNYDFDCICQCCFRIDRSHHVTIFCLKWSYTRIRYF